MKYLWFPIILLAIPLTAIVISLVRRNRGGVVVGQMSWWRKAIGVGVALAVGVLVWKLGPRALAMTGLSQPQADLWAAIILVVFGAVALWRLKHGWWLPFVFMAGAFMFARASASQTMLVQPGSLLAIFGSGHNLTWWTLGCLGLAVVTALIEQSRVTWMAIVLIGAIMVLPNMAEPFLRAERHAVTTQRGGYKAQYGVAYFHDGLVTIDPDLRGPRGIYSVFGAYSDGYQRVIRLEDGQTIKFWRTNMTQPNLELVEVQLGGAGWVCPFADGRVRFLSPVKEGDLEVRLPPEVLTGDIQFGMKIY